MRLVTALAMLATSASFGAAAHVGPHPGAGIGFEQHLGAHVPLALPFVDERGERTTLHDALAHAPAILVMGYVRCRDLCSLAVPGTAEALDRAGLRAGTDYRAVFASIDAREDAQALAAGMARIPPVDRAGWRFVGGDDASARALADAVGFRYRYERDRDAFAHPAGLVVLSPDGLVSRYFFGVRFEPADLRMALAEAGQGRTGRISDRLLLLCYHFDPATGRYTPRVWDALRLAIAVFAAGAGLLAWRAVRQRKAAAGAP
jgi:protein SCO1/2